MQIVFFIAGMRQSAQKGLGLRGTVELSRQPAELRYPDTEDARGVNGRNQAAMKPTVGFLRHRLQLLLYVVHIENLFYRIQLKNMTSVYQMHSVLSRGEC